MYKKRLLLLGTGLISLLTGSAIYLIYRPESLLMFRWIESVGLYDALMLVRQEFKVSELLFSGWVIQSLPFGLWVLSYMLIITAIWADSDSESYKLWFWIVPIISIISELFQSLRILPGVFDIVDLATIVLLIFFALIMANYNCFTRGVCNYE